LKDYHLLQILKETGNLAPTEFKVEQNYPNPFNLSTIIRYNVPETSTISIKVYDMMGREVAILITERNNQGNYSISFTGNGLASGVYYYRIKGETIKVQLERVLLRPKK